MAASCAGSRGAGSGGAASGSSGAAGGGTATLEAGRYDEITREDRVGTGDRTEPDGRNDARFTATVTGRVSALILTICDGPGSHTSSQWDTVVGQDAMPEGFLHRVGHETWVLGVADAQGRLLNRGDGSFPEQNFDRPTQLRLYASLTDTLQGGRTVCLTVLRPDGAPSTASADIRNPPE